MTRNSSERGKTQRRLDAVARTYLDREGPRPRLTVVAGADEVSTAAACACLQKAAARIGLPTVLLANGNDVVDLELAHEGTPPLVIYHHGAVRDRHLDRLRPPGGAGPDLLLWDLPRADRVGLRSLYHMGLMMWSLQPTQARCLIPHEAVFPGGEQPGSSREPTDALEPRRASSLAMVRHRVRAGLSGAGVEQKVEVLQRPGTWRDERTEALLGQILHSLLASAGRSKRKAEPRELRASGSGPRIWSWVFALMILGALFGANQAQARSISVEINQLDLAAPTATAEGGARIWKGASYLLRLQPGVGQRLAGGGIGVSTDEEVLFTDLDGEPLVRGGGWQKIDSPLVMHATEFTLEVRHGRVRAGPASIVIEPRISGPPLPGSQGLFLSGVILMVILFMTWRAAGIRRKLDQPYQSVRTRFRSRRGGDR